MEVNRHDNTRQRKRKEIRVGQAFSQRLENRKRERGQKQEINYRFGRYRFKGTIAMKGYQGGVYWEGAIGETGEKIVETHTSESLKALDGNFENFHYQLDDGDKYKLTEGESDWLLNWVRGRYVIADHLMEHTKEDEEGALIYTIDTLSLGEALEADQSFPKAIMLSDDSALQAIFFYSACESIRD